MTVAAIIPVLGRHGLVETTIRRLKSHCGVAHVVCVVSNTSDETVCRLAGADTVRHPNTMLGDKWNKGFRYAMDTYDPDYYLYVGSSDWISSDWVMEGVRRLKATGKGMVGRRDFYVLDYGPSEKRLCYWPGYWEPDRIDEPIGIGRILTRDTIRKMKGNPFYATQDRSLDWTMWQKVLKLQVGFDYIPGKVKAVSVSCYKWPNKHIFEDHWNGHEPGYRVTNPESWIRRNFPDVKGFTL